MQEASLVGLVVVNRLVAELLHILGKGQTGSIPRLIDLDFKVNGFGSKQGTQNARLPSRWFVHHQPSDSPFQDSEAQDDLRQLAAKHRSGS